MNKETKELIKERLNQHRDLLYQRDFPKFQGRQFTEERQVAHLKIADFMSGHTLTVNDQNRTVVFTDPYGRVNEHLNLTITSIRREWRGIFNDAQGRYHDEFLRFIDHDPVLASFKPALDQVMISQAFQASHNLMYALTGDNLKWRMRRTIATLNRLIPQKARKLAYKHFGLNATLQHLNTVWHYQELLEQLPDPIATAFAHLIQTHPRREMSVEAATKLVRQELPQNNNPFSAEPQTISRAAWRRFLTLTSGQVNTLFESGNPYSLIQLITNAQVTPRLTTLKHLNSVGRRLYDKPEIFVAYTRMISRHTQKMRGIRAFTSNLGTYIADHLASLESLDKNQANRDFDYYWRRADEWHKQQEGLQLEQWRASIAEQAKHDPNIRARLHAEYAMAVEQYDDTDYQIVPLRNLDALHEESARMDHCVHSYGDTCLLGHTRIYSLRQAGVSLATVELSYTLNPTPGWRVVQIQGPRNQPVTPKLKEVAQRLAAAYTKAFPHAHDDIRPKAANYAGSHIHVPGRLAPEHELPF